LVRAAPSSVCLVTCSAARLVISPAAAALYLALVGADRPGTVEGWLNKSTLLPSSIGPGKHDLGLGSPAVPVWLIAPRSRYGLGLLPQVRLVREPLMGTYGLIADS
jgi:hypothetical protein